MSKNTPVTGTAMLALLDFPTDQIHDDASEALLDDDRVTHAGHDITSGDRVEVKYTPNENGGTYNNGEPTNYIGYARGLVLTETGRAHLSLVDSQAYCEAEASSPDRIVVCSLTPKTIVGDASATLSAYRRHMREMSSELHEVVVFG